MCTWRSPRFKLHSQHGELDRTRRASVDGYAYACHDRDQYVTGPGTLLTLLSETLDSRYVGLLLDCTLSLVWTVEGLGESKERRSSISSKSSWKMCVNTAQLSGLPVTQVSAERLFAALKLLLIDTWSRLKDDILHAVLYCSRVLMVLKKASVSSGHK